MPTFIVQGRYSAEAIKGFVAKPEDREKTVAKVVEAAGGKLRGYYVTTGDKDFIAIAEADDVDVAAAAILAAAAGGGVTDTTTQRAWTGKEFKKLCEKAKGVTGAYKLPGK